MNTSAKVQVDACSFAELMSLSVVYAHQTAQTLTITSICPKQPQYTRSTATATVLDKIVLDGVVQVTPSHARKKNSGDFSKGSRELRVP